MPIIQTVPPEDATGAVAQIYGAMKEAIGFVPNGIQALSASPHCLGAQADHIGYYMGQTALGGPLLAAIRYLVAGHTDCEYCIGMNMGMLMQAGLERAQIEAAREDTELLPFDERDKAMLRLALKVIHNSSGITAADLDTVRAHGWNDQEILEGISHAAHAVAVDMVLNAVKVEADVM